MGGFADLEGKVRRATATDVFLLALPIFILSLFLAGLLLFLCGYHDSVIQTISCSPTYGGGLATVVWPSALFILLGLGQSNRRIAGAFGAVVCLVLTLTAIAFATA